MKTLISFGLFSMFFFFVVVFFHNDSQAFFLCCFVWVEQNWSSWVKTISLNSLTSFSKTVVDERVLTRPVCLLWTENRQGWPRSQTRLRDTGTDWMPSWTVWPACFRSLQMSSPNWTSCQCCVSAWAISASRASFKVRSTMRLSSEGFYPVTWG